LATPHPAALRGGKLAPNRDSGKRAPPGITGAHQGSLGLTGLTGVHRGAPGSLQGRFALQSPLD